jgi:broad specificity phosphatase PhoE
MPLTRPLLLSLLLLGGCADIGLPRVIYLARHGQTEWNRLGRFQGDPDLDQVGYVNRVSLWLLLKDQPIAAIYTSERQRTQRTAELVARQHELTIEKRAAINEIAPGVLEGVCFSQMAPHRARPSDRACEVISRGSSPDVTLRQIQAIARAAAADPLGGRFPLSENYYDLVKRTATFVDELGRGHASREVLVVGHGVINRVLLHHLMGWPLELVAPLRQENDQVFRLEVIAGASRPRLSLYTPGFGWRACSAPSRPVKHLDCSPLRDVAPQLRDVAPPPTSSPSTQPGPPR